MKIVKRIPFLLLCLLLSLPVQVFGKHANTPANDIGYNDYMYSSFENLRSPFRDSNYNDKEIVINEKYHQPREHGDTHEGVDLSSPKYTNAYAVWKGKVKDVRYSSTDISNNRVIVQLDLNQDGVYNENVYAVYMHVIEILVTDEQEVTVNTPVAKTGYYGSDPNKGIHLHFGLTKNTSANYGDLVWTPHYFYYKSSPLYNQGKDFDFLYNHIPPSSGSGIVQISGYRKPDSTTTRSQLVNVKLYHRLAGSSNTWQEALMTYDGSFQYSKDLHSLGYSDGQQIEYLFVGTADLASSTYEWGYAPGTYFMPPHNPNDYFPGTTTKGTYNSYSYTIPNSDPDPYEPNDTMSSATSIAIKTYYYPYIAKAGDVDYFKIYGSAGTTYDIKMSSIPPGTDYDMKLYNSSGTQLGSSTAGSNNNELISFTPSSSDYYYIKVYGYNNSYHATDSYQLYVTTGSNGDSYEPNDTMSSATSISMGTNYYPTIHTTSDIDYFKTYVNSGFTMNIKMTSIPPDTDYDIKLYDSSGTQLAVSQAGSNSDESITYTPSSSGTYYIKVYPWSGSHATDSYTLRIN
jgi:hypothetical protein